MSPSQRTASYRAFNALGNANSTEENDTIPDT